MGKQIIKQPNDKYALFSTNIDDFVLMNATRNECIEYIIKEIIELETDRLLDKFDKIDSGHPEKVYFDFVITWKQALKTVRDIHGEGYLKEMLDEIEKSKNVNDESFEKKVFKIIRSDI